MTFIKSPNNMVEMNQINGGNKTLMRTSKGKRK